EGDEQSLEEARLVADVAHQDEHRHRHELVLLHEPDRLQVGKVEDDVAQADEAEDEREEKERERDRDADEDRSQHHQEHHCAEELEKVHTSTFSRCSNSLLKRIWYQHLSDSETAWTMKSSAASGTEARNGHRMGRQGDCSEVSLMTYAYQASSTLITKKVIIAGKKRRMYEPRSIMPFLRSEYLSQSMSVRTCAP